MFGLTELARLKLYESTLRQAVYDAKMLGSLHGPALMVGIATIGQTAALSGADPRAFHFRATLEETVETVPSSALPTVDTILARSILPGGVGPEAARYQVLTLLNGLVFVRIVEVTRPRLVNRAHSFRLAALGLLEPAFQQCLQMLSAAGDTHADTLAQNLREELDEMYGFLDSRESIVGVWTAAEMALAAFPPSADASGLLSRVNSLTLAEAGNALIELRRLVQGFRDKSAHGFVHGTRLIQRLIEIRVCKLLADDGIIPTELAELEDEVRHRLNFMKHLIDRETETEATTAESENGVGIPRGKTVPHHIL